MRLLSPKEIEQGERMRFHLRRSGFVCEDNDLRHEVWSHDDGRRCTLTLIGSLHDPVEAELYDRRFQPDVTLAYNSKGLHDLLGREG